MSKVINRELADDIALFCSYIYWTFDEELNGTFFNTFDKVKKIAIDFSEMHKHTTWGITVEWDEEVEKYFKENYDYRK